MQLDLLRHGQTELGHTLRGSTDDALTAQGWNAMQHTVDQSSQPWQIILTSPLQRCHAFAQALANQLKLPYSTVNDLQEMHFGAWEGQTTQDLYKTCPEELAQFWQSPTQFTPPQAESIHAFSARIDNAIRQIEQIMQVKQLNHALVVTHGGVIKYLKCRALAESLDAILTMSAELAQLHHFNIHHGELASI